MDSLFSCFILTHVMTKLSCKNQYFCNLHPIISKVNITNLHIQRSLQEVDEEKEIL